MLKYILRRLLFFIPTLIIISLLAFIISINAPGDPLDIVVSSSQNGGESGEMKANQSIQKEYWRKKLGLDLPVFYCGIKSFAEPDTLYKVFDKEERNALERLISKYGNWKEIQQYYLAIIKLQNHINSLNKERIIPTSGRFGALWLEGDFLGTLNEIKFDIRSLRYTYDDNIIKDKLKKIHDFYNDFWLTPEISKSLANWFQPFSILLEELNKDYLLIHINSTKWKNYIPAISFHGIHNQYHRWMFGDESTGSKGLIRGDFGTSYYTKQPISEIIWNKMGWTLFFSLLSVIIAYFISIPIGIKAAARKGKSFDRVSSVILFMLYSMPVFWTATLLLMTFANPDVLYIFKASGVQPTGGFHEGASIFEKIKLSIPYLILPTICYTYSSLAFISRTMRVSMLEVLSQDYIRTARAKGLPENKVIYKHAFRNSLFPIITVFANIFPYVISGSVILEFIFTIPGMGMETLNAIDEKNYPMIIAVFTLTGFLTLIGYLVSDILYAFADPRISYSK
jgi:peptide/nickel transport system permease protein